jgi:hypothetical protein
MIIRLPSNSIGKCWKGATVNVKTNYVTIHAFLRLGKEISQRWCTRILSSPVVTLVVRAASWCWHEGYLSWPDGRYFELASPFVVAHFAFFLAIPIPVSFSYILPFPVLSHLSSVLHFSSIVPFGCYRNWQRKLEAVKQPILTPLKKLEKREEGSI